jgi:hypothetical protein
LLVDLLVCTGRSDFLQCDQSFICHVDSAKRIEALRLGAVATIGKPSDGVSFDLKEKRASEIVRTLRRALDLPTIGEPIILPAEPGKPDRTAEAFAARTWPRMRIAARTVDVI